jgi:hypothetical protein
VNVRDHQVPERVIHQAVLGETAQTVEAGGADSNVKVAPSISRTSVAGMEVALVGHFQQLGFKYGCQAFADRHDPLARRAVCHGMTCTNGFTPTSTQAPPAT